MLCEELHVTQYKCDEAEVGVYCRRLVLIDWTPTNDPNLVGDFNVDVCLDLFDLVSIPLALLTQLVNVPTRLSSTSASAIDHTQFETFSAIWEGRGSRCLDVLHPQQSGAHQMESFMTVVSCEASDESAW